MGWIKDADGRPENLMGGGGWKLRFPRGLYAKAGLLFVFMLSIASVEIALALYFKKELKEDFLAVAEFDDRERILLKGMAASSEILNEFSVPPGAMVFFRVSLWEKRLRELADLEREIARDPAFDLENPTRCADAAKGLTHLLTSDPDNVELREFSVRAKRLIGAFNLDLQNALTRVRENRANLVSRYGVKSDFYGWMLLVIGLNGLLIGFIVGGLFMARMLASLKKLQERTEKISGGDYGVPLKIDRDDEIGLLVGSINKMASSLAAREQELEGFHLRMYQQEKMFTVGSFAAGMAHEIGNPLQALTALNSKVMDNLAQLPGTDVLDKAISDLALMAEQIERLGTVIREVRGFAYTGPTEPELTDVNAAATTATRLIRFDKRFANVDVVEDLSSQVPAIIAVSDHLVQVLINLLINSGDAMEDRPGEVVVSTRFEDDRVVIRVSDDGRGMDDEALGRAFEPFFTTKGKHNGTGLGLAVCKQIIEDHNGDIAISSRDGGGTTVRVSLPVGDVRGEREAAE